MKRLYWEIKNYISYVYWAIKDYDRVCSDYTKVMLHATNDKLSKIGYNVDDVIREIDDIQNEYYLEFYSEEVSNILEDGGTIEDIKEYFNIKESCKK